jgi:hypothetical protein
MVALACTALMAGIFALADELVKVQYSGFALAFWEAEAHEFTF